MDIKALTLSSLVLVGSIGNNGMADEIIPIDRIQNETQEVKERVVSILLEDARGLYNGCPNGGKEENRINIWIEKNEPDFYSKIIQECLKNYSKGGYLNLANYNLPLGLGEGTSKVDFIDYIKITWIRNIIDNQQGLKKVFQDDLNIIIKELTQFDENYSNGVALREISLSQRRAYNLFTELKKNNFPVELLEGMIGFIVKYLF